MDAPPYVITRNTSAAQDPPSAPTRPDGGLFDYAMRYSNGWLYCFTNEVEVLAGALCGDVDAYLAMEEQDRLVARIMASIGFQVEAQAVLNQQAVQTGRWAKCTSSEVAALSGRRDTQPSGWNAELFDGVDWWLCDCTLILVASAFTPWSSVPLPMTSENRLWVIDPVTTEDWLETLSEPAGIIDLFCATG